jgi:hypothetical protein
MFTKGYGYLLSAGTDCIEAVSDQAQDSAHGRTVSCSEFRLLLKSYGLNYKKLLISTRLAQS